MATDTAYTSGGDAVGGETNAPALETPLARSALGMLRSRVIVLGVLMTVSWLTPQIYVERRVRYVAGVLLLMHVVSALYIRYTADRRRARWVAATEVAADACGCGVLLGAGSFSGAGLPLGAVVCVIAYDTGGWRALVTAAGCMILVAVLTQWRNLGTPLILSPTRAFTTTLRVDPGFAGTPALPGARLVAPTTLDIDPSYAGSLLAAPQWLSFRTTLRVDPSLAGVSTLGASPKVFVPAVGLALLAICVGSGASAMAASYTDPGAAGPWSSR